MSKKRWSQEQLEYNLNAAQLLDEYETTIDEMEKLMDEKNLRYIYDAKNHKVIFQRTQIEQYLQKREIPLSVQRAEEAKAAKATRDSELPSVIVVADDKAEELKAAFEGNPNVKVEALLPTCDDPDFDPSDDTCKDCMAAKAKDDLSDLDFASLSEGIHNETSDIGDSFDIDNIEEQSEGFGRE